MKITIKEENELVLLDCKRVIEDVVTDTDPFGKAIYPYTLWACKYTTNTPGIEVSCVAGEPTRYWFDNRITASELRGIKAQLPETQYFVLRCGNKRPRWTIIRADKYVAKQAKAGLTPEQIKDAVLAGKTVHWMSDLYKVSFRFNEWNLDCDSSDSTWGLIKPDGTFYNNYQAKDFFVA
jgi:hypothetical protein